MKLKAKSITRKEKTMVHRKFLWLGLFAILSLFIFSCATQMYSKEGAIAERKKLMKANSKANKAIKKALKAKDFATIEAKAKVIAASMDKLPDLFPKGSTSQKSRAKAAIWKKWDEFKKKAAATKTAATKLGEAARAKDVKMASANVKALKCGGCHKPFRAKKKKKKK